MKICRLKDFGTICLLVFLRQQRFIMQLQRYLVLSFSDVDGAGLPVGQQ